MHDDRLGAGLRERGSSATGGEDRPVDLEDVLEPVPCLGPLVDEAHGSLAQEADVAGRVARVWAALEGHAVEAAKKLLTW